MQSDAKIPSALKAVAGLLVARGAYAAIIAIVQPQPNALNLDILCILFGLMLLNRRRWARTWALIFIGFGILISILRLINLLPGLAPNPWQFYGVWVERRFWPLQLLALLTLLCLNMWQWSVLKRPEIEQLFDVAA